MAGTTGRNAAQKGSSRCFGAAAGWKRRWCRHPSQESCDLVPLFHQILALQLVELSGARRHPKQFMSGRSLYPRRIAASAASSCAPKAPKNPKRLLNHWQAPIRRPKKAIEWVRFFSQMWDPFPHPIRVYSIKCVPRTPVKPSFKVPL